MYGNTQVKTFKLLFGDLKELNDFLKQYSDNVVDIQTHTVKEETGVNSIVAVVIYVESY